jgi:membrane protease YdiL (CAAX protease family)
MDLAFARVYLWRRSLAAPMIRHCLVDFISIVGVPVLGMK